MQGTIMRLADYYANQRRLEKQQAVPAAQPPTPISTTPAQTGQQTRIPRLADVWRKTGEQK